LPTIAPAPPASPPPQAAAPLLHIGTLEVRVIDPAPTQPVKVDLRHAPPRTARPPAATAGVIARGFGVFGMGQS
jgi:hypothetical protein